jgi:hypothetical protein
MALKRSYISFTLLAVALCVLCIQCRTADAQERGPDAADSEAGTFDVEVAAKLQPGPDYRAASEEDEGVAYAKVSSNGDPADSRNHQAVLSTFEGVYG